MMQLARSATWIDTFWDDFTPFITNPFHPPDLQKTARGEILLGQAIDEFGNTTGEVRLSLNSFTQDVLVTGTIGAGKTFLIVYLLAGLIARGVPCWVFDRMGDITRYLLWLFGPEHINVFDLATFRHNPLAAKDWREAMNRLRRPMREDYLRDGSLNLGSQTVKELYESDGPKPPAFRDLYDALEQKRFPSVSRRQAYKESLQNRLFSWTSFIEAYNCRVGFPIKELLKQTCVFDIKGVSPDLAAFFIKELAVSIEAELLDTSEGELQLILALDEIHLTDSREMMNRNDVGEATIRQVARSLRHCGCGMLAGDQLPALVPNALIGLMNTKIAFLTPDGPSQLTLANSMALTDDQRDFLAKLDKNRRQAVVHSSAFSGEGAFLLQVPFIKLEKASLAEVENAKQISASRFTWTPLESGQPNAEVVASQKAGIKAHHVARNDDRSHPAEAEPMQPDLGGLTKRELDYLEDIAARPFLDATKRDKSMTPPVSPSVGSERRKKLAGRGLITSHRVQLVPHGGMTTLVEITDKGWALLKSVKSKASQPPGRGSFIHKLWQHKIAEHVKAQLPDAEVTIEDGERAVDVVVCTSTETVGIEISISTRPETETEHVKGNLNFCKRVIVLAETENHLAGIKAMLESELGTSDRQRVSFGLLGQFINAAAPSQASLP